MKKIINITKILLISIILTACSPKPYEKQDTSVQSKEFTNAIYKLQNTKSIIVYRRGLEDKTREILLTPIKILSEEKVNKIIKILSDSSEYNGPVNQPFPARELKFIDKYGNIIASYIYNGASILKINDKKYILYDFDTEYLDLLLKE